jgi:hypothetical protein
MYQRLGVIIIVAADGIDMRADIQQVRIGGAEIIKAAAVDLQDGDVRRLVVVIDAFYVVLGAVSRRDPGGGGPVDDVVIRDGNPVAGDEEAAPDPDQDALGVLPLQIKYSRGAFSEDIRAGERLGQAQAFSEVRI